MIKTELQKYPHTPTPQKSIEIKKKKTKPFGSICKSWPHNRELGPRCVQIMPKMHCDKDVIRKRGRISLKRLRKVLSVSPINSITHHTRLTYRFVSFLTVTVYRGHSFKQHKQVGCWYLAFGIVWSKRTGLSQGHCTKYNSWKHSIKAIRKKISTDNNKKIVEMWLQSTFTQRKKRAQFRKNKVVINYYCFNYSFSPRNFFLPSSSDMR